MGNIIVNSQNKAYIINGKALVGRILPSGSTAYEYIQSDGTQFIDTGVGSGEVVSSVILRGACSFLSGNTTWSWVYFINVNNGSGYVGYQQDNTNDRARFFYGNNSPVGNIAGANSMVSFSLEPPNVAAGQNTRTLQNGSSSITGNILFFGNPITGGYRIAKGRIGATTIEIDGKIVRDYQPCTDSNGRAAMYDFVSKTYYYGDNTSGNDFIVGND